MNLLPVLADWQRAHGYPFTLTTEASLNLARMDALMDAMVEAGFDTVFLGIETPNPKALLKTKKPQNISRREEHFLFNAVRKIQQKGMQVQGGFILGLDDDDENVFDAQIEFIQEAGIPVALVHLLAALKGTDMYNRLKSENRLREVSIGGNAMALNFRPEMDPRILVNGFRRVTATLYDATLENYFKRCLTMFEHLKPVPHLLKPRSQHAVYAELMGVRGSLSAKQVPVYTDFIAKVARKHPRMLSKAIQLAGQGYHFEKTARQQNVIFIYGFKEFLTAELEMFRQAGAQDAEGFRKNRQALFSRVQSRYESIPDDFRYTEDGIEHAMTTFRSAVNTQAEHLSTR